MFRKILLALTLCVAVAGPARATIATLDNVPAATLLLPYFEVNPSSANPHTVVSLGNASNADVLAHVVLWTDRGVPTFSFDIRLGAYDVEQLDIGALFASGTLPITTVGTFGGCAGLLPTGPIASGTLTGLRAAHRGDASSLFSGSCAGEDHGDTLARGYITVDSVSNCSASIKFPADSGYFTAGGTGLANNANVLFGSVSTFDTAAGWAYGDSLVAIEASASDVTTDGTTDSSIPDYTFYGRVIGSAADNRESLPLGVELTSRDNAEWAGRYVLSGTFDDTAAVVWRDPGAVSAFACNNPPAYISTRTVIVFDASERPAATCAGLRTSLPLATQSVDIGDASLFDTPSETGFVWYGLALGTASGAFGTANQSYVAHVMRNGTDRTTSTAWVQSPLNTSVEVPCGPCRDGIDNDGDGDVDFPADAGCRSADAPTENPQCSNGIDDDATNGTDFPNDPSCWGPLDNSEFTSGASGNAQCDDGQDNDNDGLVDWPLDNNCFGPTDDVEAPGACSDGVDNDGDGDTDFPNDSGCASASDNNETNFACNDGVDNDNDGDTDFPNDAGCAGVDSNNEGTECDDGTDNDNDGDVDFPADAGCSSATSDTEGPACDDGVDNDGDGDTDFPNDPGCASATSGSEAPPCSDGLDNDFDGDSDFPNDPGCANAASNTENPACDNGFDDEGDGDVDYPNDADCSSASDPSENGPPVPPECNDGIDNDGDGKTDFPSDASCSSAGDSDESPDCADGLDNDADGLVDAGPNADPGCANSADENELGGSAARQCSDGIDNDNDGDVDFPADAGCTSSNDDLEFNLGDQPVPPIQYNPVPAASPLGLALIVSLLALVGILAMIRPTRG